MTQRGFKYLFRTIAPAAQAGGDSAEFVAKFIAPKLGIAPKDFKVAIIWEDGTYGSSVGTGIREGAKKNGLNIILDSSYNAKSTDLSPLVLKLKAANPDAIMCASIGSDAILLCKQMRDLDVNPKIIIGTSGGWCVPSLAPNIGKSINGIFSSDHPCMVGAKALSPEALALREEFLRRYGSTTATAHAWCGFVGAIALFKYVFPRIESLSPDEIRKAALSIDMPRGSLPNGYGLNFIPHDKPNGGQNAGAFCTIMQWLDDQLSVVYPESYAFRQPEFIPLPSWKERT